jgi:hypothetical protein
MLDIPVRAVDIPRQFILAYFRPGYSAENLQNPYELIEFFIDPTTGQVFTHHDVESYFRRITVEPASQHFIPRKNKEVIQSLLTGLGKCFTGEKDIFKQQELQELSSSL